MLQTWFKTNMNKAVHQRKLLANFKKLTPEMLAPFFLDATV